MITNPFLTPPTSLREFMIICGSSQNDRRMRKSPICNKKHLFEVFKVTLDVKIDVKNVFLFFIVF